jgi:predicted amidophosphoribosyltransferase
MSLRTCTRCGGNLPTTAFAWKNKAKGRRHSHCRQCQKGISTKHYNANKDEYISRAKKRYRDIKAENEAKLAEYLEEQKCANCRNGDPDVLVFVPLPGQVHKDTVRRLLGHSWDTVMEEIQRCEVYCANCAKKAG